MAAKYVISKTSNGKFHFVLKAGNGEVILSGQMHADLDGAKKAIAAAMESGPKDDRFQRADSQKGEPYFNLLGADGRILGRSEMYSSARARDNGIESVKKNAAGAATEDRSADAPQK